MKGSIHLIWVVVGVVLLALVAVPGLGQSLLAMITGQSMHCDITPYDYKCFCSAGEDKTVNHDLPMFGTTAFKCVPGILPSPYEFPIAFGEDEEAFGYAKEYVEDNYPACSSISMCGSPNLRSFKWSQTFVSVECSELVGETVGQVLWQVTFNLEDGSLNTVYSTACNL